jgi:hypothetical protein
VMIQFLHDFDGVEYRVLEKVAANLDKGQGHENNAYLWSDEEWRVANKAPSIPRDFRFAKISTRF